MIGVTIGGDMVVQGRTKEEFLTWVTIKEHEIFYFEWQMKWKQKILRGREKFLGLHVTLIQFLPDLTKFTAQFSEEFLNLI